MKSAIVLLSGGKDSAVAFYLALIEYERVWALSIDHPGRPRREALAAKQLAARTGTTLIAPTLPFMFTSEKGYTGLLAESLPIVTKESAYIPMRNLLFYGVAGFYAEVHQVNTIVVGSYQGEGITYPDASQNFLRKMEEVFALSLSRGYLGKCTQITFQTPLLNYDEYEVVKLGQDLGVPFELTWSCWRDQEKPCDQCYSCEERARVFSRANISSQKAEEL